MGEPIAQRGAVDLRVSQLLDPLVRRDVSVLDGLGFQEAVKVDRPAARCRFDFKRTHRAPVGATAHGREQGPPGGDDRRDVHLGKAVRRVSLTA